MASLGLAYRSYNRTFSVRPPRETRATATADVINFTAALLWWSFLPQALHITLQNQKKEIDSAVCGAIQLTSRNCCRGAAFAEVSAS